MKTKEQLIKEMVVDMAIPERIIDRVIAHQFNGVREALCDKDVVEISGFGKFVFKLKTARTRLTKLYLYNRLNEERLLDDTLCDRYRKFSLTRRIILANKIKTLKLKLHEEC